MGLNEVYSNHYNPSVMLQKAKHGYMKRRQSFASDLKTPLQVIVEGSLVFCPLDCQFIGQIVANGLMPQSRGSAQAGVEGYMARYYLLLSATPLPSSDISLTALPQIITTVDCHSISHIYVIYRNFTPYYQFLSQKFGNFKGGGKFAVTLIE